MEVQFAAVVLVGGSTVFCSGSHCWKYSLLLWFSLVEVQFAAVVLIVLSTV